MSMKKILLPIVLLLSLAAPAATPAQIVAMLTRTSQRSPLPDPKLTIPLKQFINDLGRQFQVNILFEESTLPDIQVERPILIAGPPLDQQLTTLLKLYGLVYKKQGSSSYLIVPEIKPDAPDTLQLRTPGSNSQENSLPGSALPEQTSPLVINIQGRVTDEAGEGLPGVNVLLEGTTNGTTTDVEGKYALAVPDEQGNGTLVFSFIGYVPEEITISNRTTIDISMVPDIQSLMEVVIVGYNTQSKAKLTSAVATVSGAELNTRVATSPTIMLQGQLPGLQVVQNSGEPGNEGTSLRVRGLSTFSGAGNDPLVIVDGIPGSLDVLNPNDIESISLLKDAASCAIYGSRGANGVIVVKTKTGSKQGFSVSYNYSIGISKASKLPDLIYNSVEYMGLANEARTNSGFQPIYTQAQIDLYKNATDRTQYPNHDWMNELFKSAITQNHYVNVKGGTEKTNFSIGVGLTDQSGVMRGFDYKKYTLDLGLTSKVSNRVTLGTNIQARYGDQQGILGGSQNLFLATLGQTPLYPAQTSTGEFVAAAFPTEFHGDNPIALLKSGAYSINKNYYIQGNLSLDVDITDDLVWENKGGLNFTYHKFSEFSPNISQVYYNDPSKPLNITPTTNLFAPGSSFGSDDKIYTVFYSQLKYHKLIGDHALSGFAGYQQEANNDSYLNAGRKSVYASNLVRTLNAGPGDALSNGGSNSYWAIRSYYANVKYDYKDKYLVEASVRYDGTSRLPKDTRWGLFYAFSGAWRISKESFLSNASWLNDLKLRGSWGQLGNQNIGNYPYQSVLDAANYPNAGKFNQGFKATTLVDKNLKWETTQITDIGLDFTILKEKITVTVDWFNKYTFGILRTSQIPSTVGLNAPTINDGAVRNKGIDLGVQYNNKIGDFSYHIRGTFQHYRNILEHYGTKDIYTAYYGDLTQATTIRQEGQPLDSYYLYTFDGIFQTAEEIANSPTQPNAPPTPGDLKIKDIDGNGVIDDKDRTVVQGKYPDFQYSVNVGFNWKGFDFNAQFYGSQGQKQYVSGWGIEPFFYGSVPTTDWRNRWTPTNPSQTMPKIYTGGDGYNPVQYYSSTYFLKDASFFRLKSLQLGYTVKPQMLKAVGVKSVRVYLAADNVFTRTKFPGLDPERIGNSFYAAYPQNRTFTIGANVTF